MLDAAAVCFSGSSFAIVSLLVLSSTCTYIPRSVAAVICCKNFHEMRISVVINLNLNKYEDEDE